MNRFVVSLRRQDWAAVAIQLVVVVAGVFIGLQASVWNQDRETDRRAAVFTERLKADLRIEAWNYEAYISYYKEVRANAEAAVDALTGKAPLGDEALLVAAYRATQFQETIRHRATYDELLSTGEMGLIRDRALRVLAMRTYTFTSIGDAAQEGKTAEYRRAFRMLIPYDVQLALVRKCGDRLQVPGDYGTLEHRLDYPCTTGLSAKAIADSTALLRGDPTLVLLRLRIANVSTNISALELENPDIRNGLRALARGKP